MDAPLPVRVTAVAVSSFVETFWALATGASLIGVIVMLTVTTAESTVPSLTRKVKLSAPLRLAVGVKVRLGAVPLSVHRQYVAFHGQVDRVGVQAGKVE